MVSSLTLSAVTIQDTMQLESSINVAAGKRGANTVFNDVAHLHQSAMELGLRSQEFQKMKTTIVIALLFARGALAVCPKSAATMHGEHASFNFSAERAYFLFLFAHNEHVSVDDFSRTLKVVCIFAWIAFGLPERICAA